MRMKKLLKMLTKITVVRPGDTLMLSTDMIKSNHDIVHLKTALKLDEWSAATGIKYVLLPANIHVDVVRKEA